MTDTGGVELSSATVQNTTERDAMLYLQDQAYKALLVNREPVRSGEILGAIGNDRYSAKLLRHVLAASSRFAQIDRRWDLEARYEDKQRPTERVLGEILARCGQPMLLLQLAEELSSVYQRPAEYYEPMLRRILGNADRYFSTSDGLYAPISWALEVTTDDEADLLFDNGVEMSEIEAVEATATTVDWTSGDIAATVRALVAKVGVPVSNKVIGFFLWRVQGDDFDGAALFNALHSDKEMTWMSDGRWATKSIIASYDNALAGIADRLAEEVVEEVSAPSVVERAEVEEDVAPTLSLTISERDLDEVLQIVSAKGEARLPAILENIFEISPRDPVYAVAAEGLSDAMRVDDRFIWVGGDRWRLAGTIPTHISDVPAELAIPTFDFETAEGEAIDVELEDDGLEGGLAVEIKNPLVQDVSDREPITDQDMRMEYESVRCVVTAHHKALGTFPLCRIPRSFLPVGPAIVELTFVAADKRAEVWANRSTDLAYDMAAWYTDDMPESGGVFTLNKTSKPGEYEFVYNNDTDPLVFVAPNRVEELKEMAADPRTKDLSTYDLMCRMMQDRKGLPFVTLFTELNLVRRVTRRMVASILSSYYAFYQRPKSAIWQFDEKKIDQGFKKAKRKYVKKS